MFRWCRYYYLVNPLINCVVSKLSEYPITDIVFDTEKSELRQQWQNFLLEDLRYRAFQIEVGLDYYTYGNALISIFYPFIKLLECPKCKKKAPARDTDYRFQNFQFVISCGCGYHGPAIPHDHYVGAPKGIRLLRWNPEDVDIQYNDITGEYTYYYTIPTPLRNDIIIGRKATVETVPQLFIDALRFKKAVVFSRDNIFHFKRPTLANKDRGWGTPMILPVLKDTFYLQILKKAQESIALEHIVPLRILFPQAGSATSDPYTTINLADWRDQVASEIRRWRSDNNYIPILPLPVGNQTIGGDGRALLLSQEIRVWSEHIIAGMGVPVELIFGGISYSGSNVSLRMLENMFLGYLQDHLTLLRWVIRNVSAYLGWPQIRVRFKPFKMADDLQRKAYLFQLNQAGKLSDESLLSDADFDSAKEDAIMERETERRSGAFRKQKLMEAEIQGEAQLVMSKWQLKAQTIATQQQTAIQSAATKNQLALQQAVQQGADIGPPEMDMPKEVKSPLTLQTMQPFQQVEGEPTGQQNVDILYMAKRLADRFNSLSEIEKTQALTQLREENPPLHDLVLELMMNRPEGMAAAGRPLPLQKPPRRGPESAQI